MKTDIPVGSFVRYKYKGEYQYAQVSIFNTQLTLLLMQEQNIPPNEVINCKWGKNETLLRKD